MAATHSLDLESSSSQYASIADASCPNLKITSSQTWEAWIKLESFVSAGRTIMGRSNAGATQILRLEVNPTAGAADSRINFQITGLTGATNVASVTNLATGVWVHVAGVYDATGTTLKVYINGELENTATASGTANNPTSKFGIGILGDYGSFNYFDGMIRNARVWNVARTQAQIRADMNVDTPSVTTGLQGNWILNNAYTDSSGNGYTLTASGSPAFSTTYPDALALTENGVYTKKHKITVQHGQVAGSTDLTDVPIVLTESNFLTDAFNNTLNGGADLRFSTDIDGKIRLAHEVVSWNTGTDTGEIWVKANTLDYDNDTDIYVHYGNATATAIDENEAFGKHQVWGSNWKGVWHLNEASGTRMDASKNSNDLTDNNTVPSATGKVGTGVDFERNNSEYLSRTHAAQVGLEITGSQTWMIWLNPESRNDSRIMDKNTNARGFIDFGSNGYFFVMGGLATNTSVQSSVTPTLAAWHMLTGIYDSAASKLKIFHNTTKTEVTASGTVSSSTSQFTIAALHNGASNYWDGLADEARVYNGALSDDFITTLYNNQNAPSTFAIPSAVSSSNENFFMFL